MSKTIKEASLPFYVGVIVVAIGGAGVLVFKPKADDRHDSVPGTAAVESTGTMTGGVIPEDEAETGGDSSPETGGEASGDKSLARKTGDWVLMILAILMTAFCWGSYGPVLHRGQAQMAGSRLRPFLCVGLAYFVIAVLVPIPWLQYDPGTWTFAGSSWSLVAGTAGALGALGIIYAFNFGGRPIFVMPLVFGLAPVVNTLSTTLVSNLWGRIGWPFTISLMLVILGAITVLVMAPRPKPPESKPPESKSKRPSRKKSRIEESTEVAVETER